MDAVRGRSGLIVSVAMAMAMAVAVAVAMAMAMAVATAGLVRAVRPPIAAIATSDRFEQ